MDADGSRLARGLLADDALDVDLIFETVDGGDFAFTALVRPSDDEHLIVFSDWDGADLKVLLDLTEVMKAMQSNAHCASLGVLSTMVRS